MLKKLAALIKGKKEPARYFETGRKCPAIAYKAYDNAVKRISRYGRSQAVVYMPGHVGYTAVHWYPGLEELIPKLGGRFIGGLAV